MARATLRSIAADAGVSHQTVSRVLNGDPGVTPSTRDRVLAVAAAQGYSAPRPAGARVVRSNVISMVVPYGADDLFADPHLLEVVHGSTRALTARGRRLLLSLPSTSQERESVFDVVEQDDLADGLIVEGSIGDSGLARIARTGTPLVVVGYTDMPVPSVHGDDAGGAYALAQHLLALGHRAIGIIDGPAGENLALDARRNGVARAIADAARGGIVASEGGDYTARSGAAAVERLMAASTPPTAILSMNDRMAIGAIGRLQHLGVSVPADVSVTGFDDIAAASFVTPGLTTARVPAEELGERAAALLIDSGLDPRPGTTVLPVQLVVRSSTAAVRS